MEICTDIRSPYLFQRLIGTGRYSKVYIATRYDINKKVVIKVIKKDTKNKILQNRILLDVEIPQLVSHPNIVTIVDFIQSKNFAYLIYPYKPNSYPLVDMKLKDISLSNIDHFRYLIDISFQTADAIECLHSNNIVHRDIKPENIIISGSHVTLIDFNLSAIINDSEHPVETGFIGSPMYISPEVWKKDNIIDYGALDIYSFGMTLYNIFNKGRFAYKAKTTEQLENELLYENPRPSRSRYSRLDRLIDSMLKKIPDFRPSIDKVKRVLNKYQGQYTVPLSKDIFEIRKLLPTEMALSKTY